MSIGQYLWTLSNDEEVIRWYDQKMYFLSGYPTKFLATPGLTCVNLDFRFKTYHLFGQLISGNYQQEFASQITKTSLSLDLWSEVFD